MYGILGLIAMLETMLPRIRRGGVCICEDNR